MRILTVSDTVAEVLLDRESTIDQPQPDLIISCGDLPPEYLSSLRNRFDAPLIYILGNHDIRYGSSPPSGCQLIDRMVYTIGNIRIIGFSGSRWYNGGANQYSEREMANFIRKMRFNLWRGGAPDIVVTHAPPRFIGDAEDPCHKGFRGFVKFIEKYSPSYFLHGHIHKLFTSDSERITQFNSTKVVNSYGFYFFEI